MNALKPIEFILKSFRVRRGSLGCVSVYNGYAIDVCGYYSWLFLCIPIGKAEGYGCWRCLAKYGNTVDPEKRSGILFLQRFPRENLGPAPLFPECTVHPRLLSPARA